MLLAWFDRSVASRTRPGAFRCGSFFVEPLRPFASNICLAGMVSGDTRENLVVCDRDSLGS